MRLFVETAKDGYGNRGYGYVVIGGSVEGDSITVQSPAAFASSWPTIRIHLFQEVSQEAGPPRYLTGDTMDAIKEMNRLIKEHSLQT